MSIYEIEIQGHLDVKRILWIDQVEARTLPDGRMVLRTGLIDQATLHSLLNHIRDLGIPLLAFRIVQGE
jgi:hypothetical protein